MHKIILIRHGESLGNVDGKYYELPDCANILTEKGVQQCVELSKKLSSYMEADLHWSQTTVISSKYQRAKLTAQIVMTGVATNKHLPIIEDARINECVYTVKGVPLESTKSMIQRLKSCVDSNPFNLILFTHGKLMETACDKQDVHNTECFVYDRDEFVEMLTKKAQNV